MDLTRVYAPNGTWFTVDRNAAPNFTKLMQGFGDLGYYPDQAQSGGYNHRNIAGSNKLSQHSHGRAIDLDWNRNAEGRPGAISLLGDNFVKDYAAAHGVKWGGAWGHLPRGRDDMHFEATGAPVDELARRAALEKYHTGLDETGNITGIPTAFQQGIQPAVPAAKPATAMAMPRPVPPQQQPQQGAPMARALFDEEPTGLSPATWSMPNSFGEFMTRAQGPMAQGGLGLFLAASQGKDLNQGLSAGAERGNVFQQQEMMRMKVAEEKERRARMMKMLSDPAALPDIPDAIANVARATGDPSVIQKYVTDRYSNMPNSVREFSHAQNNPAYASWLQDKRRREAEFGKQGAIFQAEDGSYYTIQFGSDGQKIVAPVEAKPGQPLRPAKGVMQVGDELMDKGDGRTVRNVAPQIANKEAVEEVGKLRGRSEADLPRMIDNAAQALDVIDQIRKHPGKYYGTGAILGNLPAIPGTPQAGFVDLVDQAKGKTFLEAFNSLKGGGQITEAEGKKAEQAIARLNRARSQEDFDKALADLEQVIQAGAIRGYRAAGQKPQPVQPSPGGGSIPPGQPNPVAPAPAVPEATAPKPAAPTARPPAHHIDRLKANPTPEMKKFFDDKYGPHSADYVLGGGR